MSARAQVGVVFLLAFALRFAVLMQLSDVPLFRTPQLDSLEYLQWATRIASGDFSWPENPIHGPGYPLFLGAALAVTRSLFGARVIQALVGAGSAVLVYLLADLVERRRPGGAFPLASGLLAAVYGPLVFMDVSIYGEGLLVFLLTLAAYIALRAGRFHHILAGLAFGFAVIVRPTSLVLAPLFLLAMRKPRNIILFTLFAAYPVAPVIFHNWSATGEVVAVQASGGMNFLIGNSPKHDGTAWARPGGEWDRLRGAAWRAGVRGSEDRFYLAQVFNEIRSSPLAYVRLLGRKLLWLVQADEIRDSHSYAFFTSHSFLLRWLPGFGVLFALSVLSATLWFASNPRVTENTERFMIAWIVLMAGAILMLVIGYRYRLPIVPPMLVLAGGAFQRRRVGGAPLILLIAAIAFGVTHIRKHEPSHDFSEEWAMSALALRKEGNLDAARNAALHAATTNPNNSLTWLTLGDVEASRDDWAAAENAWLRAIEADPDTARAWSHLALARIRRGDMSGADAALVRSISIRPETEALENLTTLRSGR